MFEQQPAVLVDIETTGLSPGRDGITEIAVLRIDTDGRRERWQHLINPGRSIPESIQRLTGITNDMVADAPCFDELAAELWQRLDGALFVAHNVRFDYGFLRQAFSACGYEFRPKLVCTVKLARALFPEWGRYSLDKVCGRIGYHRDVAHRAMADVEAMAAFVTHVEQHADTDEVQTALKAQWRLPSLPSQLDRAAVDAIPDTCGVYRFYGDNGSLLYVGKSKQLRSRVLAHFAADAGNAREMQMARSVRTIDWTETAGELGALLLENREIKERAPVYNRRQRQYRSLWCYRLEEGPGGYLVPRLEGRPANNWSAEDTLYGLFKNRSAAKKTLEKIALEAGLCKKRLGLETGKGPCFARQLNRCAGACTGEQSPEQHNLQLQAALHGQMIKPWPWKGPVVATEQGSDGRCALHALYHWSWIRTLESPDPADLESLAEVDADSAVFDIETYRILLRHLPRCQVQPLSH